MVNAGDTAFVLIAAALVMLMTPGLAFFYGGMVRRKNILGMLIQCFALLCVLTLQWVYFGYSLAFSPGHPFWPNLNWAGLSGVSLDQVFMFKGVAAYGEHIPHQAFMIFQAMFAIITPALIVGAFAERMKFSAFLLFSLLWATFVYDPVAHWIWGAGGWMREMGVLDFAGGAVVHINAGIAALVTVLIIGRRKGYDGNPNPPHNLPFTVLGGGLLWFGWFGFNAGSALGANNIAVAAFVTTHVAGAAAGAAWILLEWMRNGRPTMFGAITGAIAGLAAITPAAGFVTPVSATIIGIIASLLGFLAVSVVKPKLNYDDSLDAFGVHGVSGIWGVIATGIFATTAVNAGGAQGLLYGETKLFYNQLICTGVTVAYSFVATFVIYKLVDLIIRVRVVEKDENIGLDLTQHRERAYTVLE